MDVKLVFWKEGTTLPRAVMTSGGLFLAGFLRENLPRSLDKDGRTEVLDLPDCTLCCTDFFSCAIWFSSIDPPRQYIYHVMLTSAG
jgi:hypothetical protein